MHELCIFYGLKKGHINTDLIPVFWIYVASIMCIVFPSKSPQKKSFFKRALDHKVLLIVKIISYVFHVNYYPLCQSHVQVAPHLNQGIKYFCPYA